MTELQAVHTQPMMSSREIGKLTGKEHYKVCSDIRMMLMQLYGGDEASYIRNSNLSYNTNQSVSCVQYDATNPNGWEYLLDRRHTEILITGYDVKHRAAVIDRWFVLESERTLRSPVELGLPNFLDPAEAAIRTKAEIGNRDGNGFRSGTRAQVSWQHVWENTLSTLPCLPSRAGVASNIRGVCCANGASSMG